MQDWTTFLKARGARLDASGLAHFAGEPAADPSGAPCLVPLSYRGLVSVTGPDAVKFLQGQLTCDLRQLAAGHALTGAQCSLKGRVITSFRLAAGSEQQVLISLPTEVLPSLQAGLQKYSVFSKETIEDASCQWLALGLMGPQADEILARHTGLRLARDGDSGHGDGLLAIRLDTHCYECWVHSDRIEALWQALAGDCRPVDSQRWQLADIRRGRAEVYAASSEVYTPQALNLDLTGAISFSKGCYTGQEVVARLHYKGTPKKRLYRVGLSRCEEAVVGAALADAGGRTQGEVVMLAAVDDTRAEALAVLPVGEAGPLQIQGTTQVVERLTLPYTLPEEQP